MIVHMVLAQFHPLIRTWFENRFSAPTEPQQLGWPAIGRGRHTLIAAPTGSGKTLSAFLVCIDRLVRQSLAGNLPDATHVVYVSPLKALSNDIQRNLQTPLAEIEALAAQEGLRELGIRVAVRTGDTPASQRQAMLRKPPHILVTTPESLYLLLTAQKSRGILGNVRTVIVDEIHALARDKRGSHLALSLQRLERLVQQQGHPPPVRIGLSATQRPIDDIARFLVGTDRMSPDGRPDCDIIDAGHVRDLDLNLEVPLDDLDAVCSLDQWGQVYQRLADLIQAHRSTLVFVNTRRLAERVAMHLQETLGAEAVASHHGSLSKALRLSAEQRLKDGKLKAIVATASLEMGIDIGFIDLVCQIGSPRSIAALLQRVGRSGHSLGALPKGRLFPLTRDELMECVALVRAVRAQRLDRIEIPKAPLDILAQQIVATVAAEEMQEDELLAMCRGAWPFAELSDDDFQDTLKMLSDGIVDGNRRGSHLHRDRLAKRLRPRRGARLAAITSGGAIPETGDYRVVTDPEGTYIGTLDEDFAIESMAGDIFLLGNSSWQIRRVKNGEVLVRDAQGAPPNVPFWFGEAPGRTAELSEEISQLRRAIVLRFEEASTNENISEANIQRVSNWIVDECQVTESAAMQAVHYVAAQVSAMGMAPTNDQIVFERFFDESGGMQLVIHSVWGSRINRAWGLALRKRFCRGFDFELQAAADDNGLLLSLGPQHSLPVQDLFGMLRPDNAERLLVQALIDVPMFEVRWRWNATRALAVLRQQGGKRVPPYLQRFRSNDLLATVFPASAGCLENHSGDREVPNHPLVKQTLEDCLREALDVDGWIRLLQCVQEGTIRLIPRDTREPSPFAHELLNANPYAFLDDAPLEERRTRAIATRRTLSTEEMRDLGKLDPDAILQVARDAWPLVRDAEELHDALVSMVAIDSKEVPEWAAWFDELLSAGRALSLHCGGRANWIATERWPEARALWPAATTNIKVALPAELDVEWETAAARVELVRGQMQHSGPTTAGELARQWGLTPSQVTAALEAIEADGTVIRGQFTDRTADGVEWCDRRLLARIHRLTLDGLRRRIQPVTPEDYLRYLTRRHGLLPDSRWSGPVAVREVVQMLQGFQIPAGAWESHVLAARVPDYDPQWLDQIFLSGECVWGRLCPPKQNGSSRPSMAALTRGVPIALMLRDDLPWLLPEQRADAQARLRSTTRVVWEVLQVRGALFLRDLAKAAELLPAQLEDALRELAAWGLVSCDAFAAVRAIIHPPKSGSRRRSLESSARSGRSPGGRWSQFPGYVEDVPRDVYLDKWARQLLRRWGVVFRDVLTRESAAPPWYALVNVFRRLERRGEIRGGRFVMGVAGEQYATEEAVEQLRRVRDDATEDPWVAISAADPLNLCGILTEGGRVAAVSSGALILHNGRFVATRQAGECAFHEDMNVPTQAEILRALHRGVRTKASLHVRV